MTTAPHTVLAHLPARRDLSVEARMLVGILAKHELVLDAAIRRRSIPVLLDALAELQRAGLATVEHRAGGTTVARHVADFGHGSAAPAAAAAPSADRQLDLFAERDVEKTGIHRRLRLVQGGRR